MQFDIAANVHMWDWGWMSPSSLSDLKNFIGIPSD